MNWNRRTLTAPPVCCVAHTAGEYLPDALKDMCAMLSEMVEVLGHQRSLQSETYVLSRLVYKRNNQMRKEKVLAGMKKVQKCLKRFEEMDLCGCIKELLENMPRLVDVHRVGVALGGKLYLPSRPMVEYCLVRLMGAAALLAQTSCYCMLTYLHATQQLSIAVFIAPMSAFAAVTSKIWSLCKQLVSRMVTWYHSLHGFHSALKPSPITWLPEGEVLAADLDSWLGEQGLLPKEHREGSEAKLEGLLARLKPSEGKASKDDVPDGQTAIIASGRNDIKDVIDPSKAAKRKSSGTRIIKLDEEDLGSPILRKVPEQRDQECQQPQPAKKSKQLSIPKPKKESKKNRKQSQVSSDFSAEVCDGFPENHCPEVPNRKENTVKIESRSQEEEHEVDHRHAEVKVKVHSKKSAKKVRVAVDRSGSSSVEALVVFGDNSRKKKKETGASSPSRSKATSETPTAKTQKNAVTSIVSPETPGLKKFERSVAKCKTFKKLLRLLESGEIGGLPCKVTKIRRRVQLCQETAQDTTSTKHKKQLLNIAKTEVVRWLNKRNKRV